MNFVIALDAQLVAYMFQAGYVVRHSLAGIPDLERSTAIP